MIKKIINFIHKYRRNIFLACLGMLFGHYLQRFLELFPPEIAGFIMGIITGVPLGGLLTVAFIKYKLWGKRK